MILITSIILVLLNQVSSFEDLYSEIEYFSGSCYPWDSCKPSRNESDDHLWGNYTCECGDHCIQYATCCADSPHVGKELHVHYRSETCKKIPYLSHAVIMVSRCSDRWRNGFHVLNQCEKAEDDIEDPVGTIPVTSLETNVTYKNYFCAVCNHDYRNTYLWNISVELSTRSTTPGIDNLTQHILLKNMVYDREEKSWGLVRDNAFYKLNLRFHVPVNLQKLVKKCYPNLVKDCDPLPLYVRKYAFQSKCFYYYSPIKVKEEGKHVKKYRNTHCALCNHVHIPDNDTSICKLDAHVPKKQKPTLSFALLLDINQDDGELVGVKKLCENDQKWDPFFKKCRSLVCAVPGFVVKNGRCVPDGAIETKF